MKSYPTTVQLYFKDGEITQRIKCTVQNWTGLVYKIPRIMIDKSYDIEELNYGGIYILIGHNDETDKDIVYIGQAGLRKNEKATLQRITEHMRDANKNFFKDVVMITTTSNYLGFTEISYLENRLYNLTKEADRVELYNQCEPPYGYITEEKRSEMAEFMDKVRFSLGALGYNFFEPLIREEKAFSEKESEEHKEEPAIMLYNESKNISAKCRFTTEGYVVLKGSKLFPYSVPSTPKHALKYRSEADISDDFILQEDKLFKSPSGAAAFVAFKSMNGNEFWFNEKGQQLKHLNV